MTSVFFCLPQYCGTRNQSNWFLGQAPVERAAAGKTNGEAEVTFGGRIVDPGSRAGMTNGEAGVTNETSRGKSGDFVKKPKTVPQHCGAVFVVGYHGEILILGPMVQGLTG